MGAPTMREPEAAVNPGPMGLFRRDDDGRARSTAGRGVSACALVQDMRPTGETKGAGIAREYEFRLRYTPQGSPPIEVVTRQLMNDLTLVGLAPGEPASVMYDAEDPTVVVIFGSPNYQIIEPGLVVRVSGS